MGCVLLFVFACIEQRARCHQLNIVCEPNEGMLGMTDCAQDLFSCDCFRFDVYFFAYSTFVLLSLTKYAICLAVVPFYSSYYCVGFFFFLSLEDVITNKSDCTYCSHGVSLCAL